MANGMLKLAQLSQSESQVSDKAEISKPNKN
jgi:hypothetical protein